MKTRWMRRLLISLIAIAIIVPAVMAAGWVGTETMIENSSREHRPVDGEDG